MAHNPFEGMSRPTLQEALLDRLNRLANARSESKYLRLKLTLARNELRDVQHDIHLIQMELYTVKFPAPSIPVEAKVVDDEPQIQRKIGRWGNVTWEPVEKPKEMPKRKRA